MLARRVHAYLITFLSANTDAFEVKAEAQNAFIQGHFHDSVHFSERVDILVTLSGDWKT